MTEIMYHFKFQWLIHNRYGLIALILLALTLQIIAIHQQPLSGDGAYHLIAGYQGWRYGQNRLNLEHPPLVKTVITLPLLFDEALLTEPVPVENILSAIDDIYANAPLIRRATIRARYMMLIFFVIPFFACCYVFGRHFGERRTGIILLFLVAFSFNILPSLTILQTDTAVSLGYLLTLLALFRLVATKSLGSALWVGGAFGFAISVKFSGFLLLPSILIAVILAKPAHRSYGFSVAALVLIAISAWLVMELSYWAVNWNYTKAAGQEIIRTYTRGQAMVVRDQMRKFETMLLAIEAVDPFLAQWMTGALGVYTQNSIGVYPIYAFGEVSYLGRYWYFPALFLIRTPLVILLAGLFSAFYFLKPYRLNNLGFCKTNLSLSYTGKFMGHKERSAELILLIVTAGTYLLTAVMSNYNLGFRHLMPVMPIVYLPVAYWLARFQWRAGLVIGVLIIEAFLLNPLWMDATNTWWLGDNNPTRFAFSSDDNSNFIQLAKYVEQHNINKLQLLSPGLGEQRLHAYIPGTVVVNVDDILKPGWYAVSTRVEQFIPALLQTPEDSALKKVALQWNPLWQVVKTGHDFGYAAGTFHIYYLAEAPVIKLDKAERP